MVSFLSSYAILRAAMFLYSFKLQIVLTASYRYQCRHKITGRFPDTSPPTVNVLKPKFSTSRGDSQALSATWLGHASCYVEFPNGLRVLFDPVFEDSCSPSGLFSQKRYTKAPCQPGEIHIIDVVIISHGHSDHLSFPSVL